MNIGIDMGHPFNCGAFGIMSETAGNRAVGKLLISKLKAKGHAVYDCTYDTNVNELANRVALANAQKLDYFISLHMDSFDNPNSNGVTIYTTANSSAKSKAIEIVNAVANSCEYNNRGWKSANFYVLKNTNAPAMLLEMGFVTNQDDCNRFNPEIIANSIVKALTGDASKNDFKLGWNKSPEGWWYRIEVEDGYYYKDTWKLIDGDWYSFDSEGYARSNKWLDDGGKWYYLKDTCKMARNEWLWIDGECYFFFSDGVMACNTITPDGYCVDETGAWIH